MKKVVAYGIFVILAMFLISGCETVPKKVKEDISGMKSRIDTLESKVDTVESKQAEADRLASEQAQAVSEMKAAREEKEAKTNFDIKPRGPKGKAHIKDIQTCLKNAGFYFGKIDGIKGKATRKAIREFQKANGLTPDGVIGKKTWEALSKHMASPASPESGGLKEEGATK